MNFETFLKQTDFILTEGSIYERLRRDPNVEYDPYIAHAGFVYDENHQAALTEACREYIDIGQKHQLPMMVVTSTWRASQARIDRSKFKGLSVNQDNVRFMMDIRDSYGPDGPPIFVGGITGPKGDAYLPQEAPNETEAVAFHILQIEALAETNIDFLKVATLPAFPEARGIATAMSRTHLPYMMSFVIRPNGTLLDGTPLAEVIETIDESIQRPPLGYGVNCVHPTNFQQGLVAAQIEERGLLSRIVSFTANTSAKSPEKLDGLAEIDTAPPAPFAEMMWAVREQFNISIMGGCCGTDRDHMACLARKQTETIGTSSHVPSSAENK